MGGRLKIYFCFTAAVFLTAFLFVNHASAAVEISDGSVQALYHFVSGSSSADSSGNNYDLDAFDIPNTTSSFVSVNLHDAFDDTTHQYVLTSATPNFNASFSAFSVFAWINKDSTSNNQRIFSNANQDSIVLVLVNNKVYCQVYVQGSGATGLSGNTTLNSGQNYHIGCLWDGSYLHVYVNGAEDATAASTASGNLRDGASALYVGEGASDTEQFTGRIDEMVLTNSSLSTSTIASLYNSGNGSEVCTTPGCSSVTVSIADGTLAQLKSDGTTAIEIASSTDESIVKFSANLQTTGTSSVQFQVEFKPYNYSFTNQANITSASVSSGTVTISTSSLPNGLYHWQGMAIDGNGVNSGWKTMSTPVAPYDFIVNANPTDSVEIPSSTVQALYHFIGSRPSYDESANNYELDGSAAPTTTTSFVSSNLRDAFNDTTHLYVLTSATPNFNSNFQNVSAFAWMQSTNSASRILSNANQDSIVLYLSQGKIACQIYIQGHGAYSVFGSTAINDNQKHLVGCVWDGSYVRIYVDSAEDATAVSTASGSLRDGASALYVGEGASDTEQFTGKIDEVLLTNSALTTSTILALYNNNNGAEVCITEGCTYSTSSPPQSFYAQIKNAATLNLRQSPNTSSDILKMLPGDWVIHVLNTLSSTGTPVVANGYRWFNVADETDSVTGWMIATSSGGTVYLSYSTSMSQAVLKEMASSTVLSTKATRAEKIVEAVNWYWDHVSSTDSLYYTGFPHLFSPTSSINSTWTFPKQLFYAMASEEDGGGLEFDNEIISPDYGHGIMQITTLATSSDIYYLQVLLNKDPDTQVATSGLGSAGNETHNFGSLTEDAVKRFQTKYGITPVSGIVGYYTLSQLNSLLPTSSIPSTFHYEEAMATSSLFNEDTLSIGPNNRGIGSNLRIPPCDELNNEGSSNYIKRCYQVPSSTYTRKTYEPHSSYGNQVFKYYTNTSQSIFSNIKDGLTVLNNVYEAASSSTTASSTTFEAYDREWIHATWAYNGQVLSTTYLTRVASKMDSFSDFISSTGTQMIATSSFTADLANKLRIADDYKEEVIVFSPVELLITDSTGRSTGVVDRVIKKEIPGSAYNSQRKAVAIFFADDTYTYNVKGMSDGTYGLLIDHPNNGSKLEIYAPTIPIKGGEIHTYTINWDSVRHGNNGVTVKIDHNGDGVIDREVITDAKLSDFADLSNVLKPAIWEPALQKENSLPFCSDGIDNDFDGFIDLTDLDCKDYIPLSQPPHLPSASTTVFSVPTLSPALPLLNYASSTITSSSSEK